MQMPFDVFQHVRHGMVFMCFRLSENAGKNRLLYVHPLVRAVQIMVRAYAADRDASYPGSAEISICFNMVIVFYFYVFRRYDVVKTKRTETENMGS